MNKNIFRSFLVLNTSFGIYGFSRGYRAESIVRDDSYIDLTSYKLTKGFFNSLMYMVPPWNVYYITKLFNRIEIDMKGLDKNMYKSEYEEIVGECNSTY